MRTFGRPAISASAAVLISLAAMTGALAAPQTIIVLRHGEKLDDYALCDTGIERSRALAAQYLGKGASNSLFAGAQPPAGFFAITLHSLELISPASSSWNLPVTTFTVVPPVKDPEWTAQLNLRTQQAVNAVMTDPQWNGKVVVMSWEHHHIADKELETRFPGQRITLRQLLNIDRLSGVPETWPGQNYDYFWIVQYDASGAPTGFTAMKQVFTAPFQNVPANDWGEDEPLPQGSRCKH